MNNQKFRKTIRYPDIKSYKKDRKTVYYVSYAVLNPSTNKMQEHKIHGKVKHLKTKKAKLAVLGKIVAETKRKLDNGWTPYNDPKYKYESVINYADKGKKRIADLKDKDFSIENYLSEALNSLAKDLRDKTFKSYQSQLRTFVKWLVSENIEGMDIKEFDVKLAQKFLDSLTLHKRTIKAYRNNLKRFFNIDSIKDIVEVNPFAQTKTVQSETTENKRAFRKNEIARIKEYCLKNEPEMWFFIQFMFYCFIRPNELRHLKVDDFDFDNNLIWIRSEIAKNKKKQSVVMPNHFASEVFEKIKEKPNSEYIFPSLQRIKRVLDRPRSKSYFTNKFSFILSELGFDYKKSKVSLYSWKHTGVVYFYKATKDLHALKEQLRHHSLEMTQIYLRSHLDIDGDILRNSFPEI